MAFWRPDDRVRMISAAAVLAWLAWAVWVAAHYFARPDELFVFIEGPLGSFPFWREAADRSARAVGGAVLVLLAAWGIGSLAIRPLREMPLDRLERPVVVLACGLALLGLVFLGLAFLQVYRPPVVIALTIAGAVAGVVALAGRRAGMARLPSVSLQDAIWAGCAALACGAALLGALAPETEYDALWYHLWLPARWLEAGRPVDLVEEYVSLYPLAWQLTGGAAMAIGGPVAAKLLHFACLPLLGITTLLITRELFPRADPMLGAALAIVTPITIWEGTTAYVDLALAWYLAVSVYALARHHASGDRRWLLLSAFLLGSALAVKHLGLVALAIVTCVVAALDVARSGRPGHAIRITTLFVAIALILPAPWYLRSYAASGNPVFPDLYAVFGATPPERWSPVTERGLQGFKDRFGAPRTPRNLIRLPWDATVHAARYGGTLGPLFLILVPAALPGRGIRRTTMLVAGGCAAYIAIWASPISSFQMRFLIPLVPLLGALGAEGASRLGRLARRTSRGGQGLVPGTIAVLLLMNLPPTSGWHEPDREQAMGWMRHIVRGGLPAAVVLGAESRTAYLERAVPSYRAWQYAGAALPQGVRVLTFSGGDHLYSTRPRIWSDSTAARAATWGTPAGHEEAALAAVRQLRITHVLFDKRQMDDGSVPALAIGSDAMRACCLTLEYEDARFALYRVRDAPSPRGIARHAWGM